VDAEVARNPLRVNCPLKPKEGLNGAPSASSFFGIVNLAPKSESPPVWAGLCSLYSFILAFSGDIVCNWLLGQIHNGISYLWDFPQVLGLDKFSGTVTRADELLEMVLG
jgi:hypothetical protein